MLPLQPRLRAVARWRKATYLRTNGKTRMPENCYVPEGKNLTLPIHDYVQCTEYYFHVLSLRLPAPESDRNSSSSDGTHESFRSVQEKLSYRGSTNHVANHVSPVSVDCNGNRTALCRVTGEPTEV